MGSGESETTFSLLLLLQLGTDRAVKIRALKYADDVNCIANTVKESSERMTSIARGSWEDSKLRDIKYNRTHYYIPIAKFVWRIF